jgi:hypothetical protein
MITINSDGIGKMEDATKKIQKMVQHRKTHIVISEQERNKKFKRQNTGTSVESYAFSSTSS